MVVKSKDSLKACFENVNIQIYLCYHMYIIMGESSKFPKS